MASAKLNFGDVKIGIGSPHPSKHLHIWTGGNVSLACPEPNHVLDVDPELTIEEEAIMSTFTFADQQAEPAEVIAESVPFESLDTGAWFAYKGAVWQKVGASTTRAYGYEASNNIAKEVFVIILDQFNPDHIPNALTSKTFVKNGGLEPEPTSDSIIAELNSERIESEVMLIESDGRIGTGSASLCQAGIEAKMCEGRIGPIDPHPESRLEVFGPYDLQEEKN